jgi:hypothetical protein
MYFSTKSYLKSTHLESKRFVITKFFINEYVQYKLCVPR